jgi:hypothetical protein
MSGQKKRIGIVLAGALMCAHAQWLNYPLPGTPRMRDGKADLSAKAPIRVAVQRSSFCSFTISDLGWSALRSNATHECVGPLPAPLETFAALHALCRDPRRS